jgi:TetR/AcrR family transcriptional regulator, transcriptional repressor of bet genes
MPGARAPEDERRAAILRAAAKVAARERLTGFTVQQAAAEAGVSKGLVFFYFESKDALLVALLEWLLERTIVAELNEECRRMESPAERLLGVIRHDIVRLPAQRERVELFFDYWVMGTRHPEIQRMIRAALDRYRDALLPLAAEVIEDEPERFAGMSAEGLAGVAASFIEGCALQVVMDPERFSVEESLRTLRALVVPAERRAGMASVHNGSIDP